METKRMAVQEAADEAAPVAERLEITPDVAVDNAK
jgi:hypothetical protein